MRAKFEFSAEADAPAEVLQKMRADFDDMIRTIRDGAPEIVRFSASVENDGKIVRENSFSRALEVQA